MKTGRVSIYSWSVASPAASLALTPRGAALSRAGATKLSRCDVAANLCYCKLEFVFVEACLPNYMIITW